MNIRFFHALALCVLFMLLLFVRPVFAQNNAIRELRLEELDGSRSTLKEYLKKGPVYMSFWALWCEPCKLELRALKNFAKDHQDSPFTIIAVNQDSPKSLGKVKAFVRSQSYPYTVVLDPNAQLFQALNGQSLPFAVLLDAKGNVVSARTGYLPGDEKEIADEILKLSSKE